MSDLNLDYLETQKRGKKKKTPKFQICSLARVSCNSCPTIFPFFNFTVFFFKPPHFLFIYSYLSDLKLSLSNRGSDALFISGGTLKVNKEGL